MMKICISCNTEIRAGKKCLDCKTGSHGLSFSEMLKIAEAQDWKCPILGTPFELRDGKIIDMDPMSKKHQRVCVDHCHSTGFIRGLLSDMGNMLVGGFDRRRYGITSDFLPTTIQHYFEKRYAHSIVGNRQFV